MRKVEVSPYKEEWAFMFSKEAEKLRRVFQSEIIAIHHIGSTAVPGLKAKPILDIMPVVRDIDAVDRFNEAMQNIGYEAKGENGIAGRRYFEKGGDNRTHHLHIFQDGDQEIRRHLAFRDYLRSHPAEKEEYGELKEELAKRFPDDIASYIAGKEALVREIEWKALRWTLN